MKQKILFVIREQFAHWEHIFGVTALQGRIQDKAFSYAVKTVSVGRAPVQSLGRLAVLSYYDVFGCPDDFAGRVLDEGSFWRGEVVKAATPLPAQALRHTKMAGAICDATVFLGISGHLNERQHACNILEDLPATAGQAYTDSALYRHEREQVVWDKNLVTANGAYLEFARKMLAVLDAYPADYIESNYPFFRQGHTALSQGFRN